MGYLTLMCDCYVCHQTFTCSPTKVPSVRVNGAREPLCRACIERANPIRRDRGLPEIVILPDAYVGDDENEMEPCDD